MEEKVMTIEEVIRITAENLKHIQIPVELSESIGIPVLRSIGNLQMCLDAMAKQKKEEEHKEKKEEGLADE